MTITAGIGQQPYQCELPTNVGNLVNFTNPNSAQSGINLGGPSNPSNPDTMLQYAVAYLLQVWYRTAGFNNPSDASNANKIKGHATLSFTGSEIHRVALTLSNPALAGRKYSGPIVNGLFGYYRFNYGAFNGPLHHLTWAKQMCVPEYDAATQFECILLPGVTGLADFIGTLSPLPGLTDYLGVELNPMKGQVNPFALNPAGLIVNQFAPIETQALATLAGGNVLDNSQSQSFVYTQDELGTVATAGFWALFNALVNEIWTYCCARQFGNSNSGAQDIAGPEIYTSDGEIIKKATLTLSVDEANSEQVFGNSGFPYLGIWAEANGDFLGEIKYINSLTPYMVPRNFDCDGIYINLKAGVKGKYNFATNPTPVLDSTTKNGQLNLVGGLVTSLLYA